ncbi:MAG: hypothetical protein WC303_02335, partial [Candidatus Paceibacterota bacterium]
MKESIEEEKVIQKNKKKAIIKFFIINTALVIVNIFGIFYFGPWEILFFGLSIIAAFAVIYLITAPQDIFGAFIDEGYFGVVVVGKG